MGHPAMKYIYSEYFDKGRRVPFGDPHHTLNLRRPLAQFGAIPCDSGRRTVGLVAEVLPQAPQVRRQITSSKQGAGKLLTKCQSPATLAAFLVDSTFLFCLLPPAMSHRAATRSSVVALLGSYQHPAFALLRLRGDKDFQLAKLVFRLLD